MEPTPKKLKFEAWEISALFEKARRRGAELIKVFEVERETAEKLKEFNQERFDLLESLALKKDDELVAKKDEAQESLHKCEARVEVLQELEQTCSELCIITREDLDKLEELVRDSLETI